jgi:hypothetical protein
MKRKFLWAGITGLMVGRAFVYSGGEGSKEHPYWMAMKGERETLANDVNIEEP